MNKNSKFILLVILFLVVGLFIFYFSTNSTDGLGWSRRCQISNDCVFVESPNAPVPVFEGCFSIKENPVIQKQNLASTKKLCECINSICQIKSK